MHDFAAALPCSYLCSEAAACGMYTKCPFLCKMLWCLKQWSLKAIFRKFFIHRHLPSVTSTGNVLHSLHLRPPWFKIMLLHIFSGTSLLSTSSLPDLVLWKEELISWPFSFVLQLPPFSLILSTLCMFRHGELVPLPHPLFHFLFSRPCFCPL